MSAKRILIALLAAAIISTTSVTAPVAAQNGQTSPVALKRELVESAVKEAYARFATDNNGKNADYIPALAHVDSKLFGIAVVSTDNQTFAVGDTNYSFSIQSISKVYTLALAMNKLGSDAVFQRVGSEPTGRPFNSPVAVVDMPSHSGNPFVNAGAIATTSLVAGGNANQRWNTILHFSR